MIGDIIRRFRLEQGLSIRQLAEQIGVTDSYISLLETSGQDPSLSVLRKLSQALKRPVSAFFEEDVPKPGITRASERLCQTQADGRFSWEPLTPADPNQAAGLILVKAELAPGASVCGKSIPGQACVYVQSGTLRVQVPETEYLMQAGDSLWLRPAASFTAVCEGSRPGSVLAAFPDGRLPEISFPELHAPEAAAKTAERSSL